MRAKNNAGLMRIVADIGISPDGFLRPLQHQEKSGAAAAGQDKYEHPAEDPGRQPFGLEMFQNIPGSNIKGCTPRCQEPNR
jgi:hypothetical protein